MVLELTTPGNKENTTIVILIILAIAVSGFLGFYISTLAMTKFSASTQTHTTTVNVDVVPDFGGATYDAFVLPSNIENTVVPSPATNTTGPGPNDNNITVTVGTTVKFVVTSWDNALNQNFTGQASTPFTAYNDTASGQVASAYNSGQSISMMAIGHTFSIPQMGVNVPIPPTTAVIFSLTFSKSGIYEYTCDSPCGPGMGLTGYMQGYIIVSPS